MSKGRACGQGAPGREGGRHRTNRTAAEAGLVGEGSHRPDGATQPETNRDPASLSRGRSRRRGEPKQPPSSGGEDGRTEALRAWGCQTEEARKSAASNVIY